VNDDIPQVLVQARIRLMLSEPYLASAVARFPLFNASGAEWCSTMATDGYHIYANPEFCATLTLPELSFVLAHEVLHCVLGHVDRRKDRDHELWNYAIDYATNLMLVELGMKMPQLGLLDQAFAGLTAEEIFDRLEAKSGGGVLGANSGGTGQLSEVGQGPGQTGGWDLHLDPADSRGEGTRLEDFPSELERARLRNALIRELSEKGQGTRAGTLASEIKASGQPRVPWKALMARFMSGLRRDDYRFMPPNKKHIWRNIYLPSVGAPGPSHIVVAIDTSGSMSDQILGRVLKEIDLLRSVTQCHLTVVQCDAEISHVDEFDEFSAADFRRMNIVGRGGTSFVPVFDWIQKQSEEKGMRFDALVYLTDGCGDFPKISPHYPVMWVLESEKHPKVPFGELIYL
jgi:predicted metal-dependent peptidase